MTNKKEYDEYVGSEKEGEQLDETNEGIPTGASFIIKLVKCPKCEKKLKIKGTEFCSECER